MVLFVGLSFSLPLVVVGSLGFFVGGGGLLLVVLAGVLAVFCLSDASVRLLWNT